MSSMVKIEDYYDDEDVLDSLEDLFDNLSVDGPTKDQMFRLYGIFLNDFIKNPIVINDVELQVNKGKSRHPICRGKMLAFEHIITRKSAYKGGFRDFDRERANKIHWIRPIIENAEDSRIKYFEAINDNGYNQQFYWYREKGYIVIVRELKPDLLLITAFSVDGSSRRKYGGMYDAYKK